jgi:hypothetical protein
MRFMRKILFALAAQAVAVGAVSAQEARPAVAPIVPCPPNVVLPTLPCPPGTMPGAPGGAPVTPYNPEVPGTPPGNVPPPAVSSADAGGGFARQSEGGTQVAQSFAPNMFGDILGARAIRLSYTVPFAARFAVAGPTTTASGGSAVIVNPNGPGGSITFGPLPNGNTIPPVNASFNSGDLTYTQPTAGGVASYDREFARSALQTLLSQGDLTPAQVAAFNQLTPAQQAQILRNRGAINQTIIQATRGLAVQTLTVGPLGGDINGGFVDYTGTLTGEQVVALPAAGGTVGRIKMAEDNSPIPRDRFIFVYDNFSNVPFTNSGITVNRYQFGVEKTFLDGRWSAEFRLPFASTLASSNVQGFESTATELGNVRFALKRIFTQNQVLTTSSGVAVTLPTASDMVAISSFDGSELYRFKNQSVTIEPFIAALYTPNSRLFAQTWASVNVDVSGGNLTWNQNVFGGEGSSRVWDLPILALSQQLGFWLVQRDTGWLRGLAPFAELHWNYTIAQDRLADEVNKRTDGYGLTVQGIATNELNLTAGLLMRLGNNLNVGVGASAPLLQRPDRTFDAQVGVRASYLYGRTAQARNPIYAVSTY